MPDNPFESTPRPTSEPTKRPKREKPVEKLFEEMTVGELRVAIARLTQEIDAEYASFQRDTKRSNPLSQGDRLPDPDTATNPKPRISGIRRKQAETPMAGVVSEARVTAKIQERARLQMRLMELESQQGNKPGE